MAKIPKEVRLSLDERLRDSPRQATSMSLPLAIHHRLDLLAQATEDVGATRAEVIGMLISNAELDPERLEPLIIDYRKKRVRNVIPSTPTPVGGQPGGNVVTLERRGPGRPRSRREPR